MSSTALSAMGAGLRRRRQRSALITSASQLIFAATSVSWKDLLNSITEGGPSPAMPAWDDRLSAEEQQACAATFGLS